MDKLTLTYALLGHYKESCKNANKSIWEIYLPIIKKALNDYFIGHEISDVKGRAITELQKKIFELFEINFPIPVLLECLLQLQEEINDESKFILYSDNSFVIKASAFENVDALIKETEVEMAVLESDFDSFCQLHKVKCDFNKLLEFINTMQIEMFTEGNVNLMDINNIVPLYINTRKNNKEIFEIISHIYTGGLLSSYLTHKIKQPVTRVELLIDTNFFISLIDLNTEDAYTTCQDLHAYCKDMGFYMTILPTTVEQIKILLSNRITDFENKDYFGTIKTADVFAACKRRGLDKTALELIRSKIGDYLKKYDITMLLPAQIQAITDSAKKSDVYKLLKEKRYNNESALNDAVAIEYVNSRRGKNCTTFADVQCWFLHNSYGSFYYDPGSSVVKRTSISASELLTMLWMSNPAQIDSLKLSRVGLTAYVTKYMEQHMPSDNTLKAIRKRAIMAIEAGDVKEEDLYSLCTRMSEGSLTQEELASQEQSADKEFSIFMAQQTVALNNIKNEALKAINADKERQKKKKQIKDLKDKRKEVANAKTGYEKALIPLEEKRQKSFKNWEPIACWCGVGIILLIGFILFYVSHATNTLQDHITLVDTLLYIIPFVFGGSVAIAIYMLTSTEKRKKRCFDKWEQAPENSEYLMLKEKIAIAEAELQSADEEIGKLQADEI